VDVGSIWVNPGDAEAKNIRKEHSLSKISLAKWLLLLSVCHCFRKMKLKHEAAFVEDIKPDMPDDERFKNLRTT